MKQGHIKSSDNYKIYNNPLLDMLDSASLGVQIGPELNSGFCACADDVFLMTDTQSKLQSMLDIANFYGVMYKVTFGAAKTKITIVGSELDRNYYSDVAPWRLGGEKVKVTDDNEHLGQLVSGVSQEQKNVDLRIQKGRKNIFGMLGPAFSYKCLLSPDLKIHLFRTYTSPIIQSGLSSFSLTTNMIEPLAVFHRKILKGILNLSKCASTPAIHFLLGELPIEGKIHRDVFSLFYSVWRNPESKIFSIVKYLLQTAPDNSRTWAIHVKNLAEKYGLLNPLDCLNMEPPSKTEFSEYIETKISAHFEQNLREKSIKSSSMKFLNVSLTGLRGRRHPCLKNLVTTQEVKKARIHIKMLVGDYLTYDMKSKRSGGSPLCNCCTDTSSPEDLIHILTQCLAYKDIRDRMFPEYSNVCSENNLNFEEMTSTDEQLCQFILDPSSLNLSKRINICDPELDKILKISRDYCYAINSTRIKILARKKI